MAEASSSQANDILKSVARANQALRELQMQQVALQNTVDRVSNTQDVTQSELRELRAQFEDFLLRDELARNLQLAQTKIIAVRQELEANYGHYREVRRLATGTLQGMDARIISQEIIRATAEKLMLTAPRYWLAPALVALAAWIRDDKALAHRALTEALRRDNDKTALFFAIVLRRQQRDDATARWLAQYVARQDASALSQEFTVVLDATATGALGPAAKPMVMEYMTEWYERLSADPQVVAAQVARWRQLIEGMRTQVDPGFTALPAISPTWPLLKDLYEGATVHGRGEAHFRGIFERPLRIDPRLVDRVDDILTTLVTAYDAEEAPHRRQELELANIIEHDGDRRAAAAATAAALSVHDETVDFLTLLTNAGFFPEQVGASDGTQRLAIALAKDWVVEAAGQLEAENVAAMPTSVELAIDGWTGTIDERASEQDLVASVRAHIDADTQRQIDAVRFGGGPLVAAVLGGVLLLFALFTLAQGAGIGALFLALPAFALGGWSAVQYQKLQPQRDHLRRVGEQRKAQATEQVRAAIAELVDWRSAWEREIDKAESFRAYMRALDREAFIISHHREVHV